MRIVTDAEHRLRAADWENKGDRMVWAALREIPAHERLHTTSSVPYNLELRI